MTVTQIDCPTCDAPTPVRSTVITAGEVIAFTDDHGHHVHDSTAVAGLVRCPNGHRASITMHFGCEVDGCISERVEVVGL